MSAYTMTGAVTLCGAGLCMIGGAMLLQAGSPALASTGTTPSAAFSIAAAASAQAAPTVVWYGIAPATGSLGTNLAFVDRVYRAWSNGTVEMKKVNWATDDCDAAIWCSSGWIEISTEAAGYRAAADVNADEKVDAVDLAAVLGNWGDAPRVPYPPSDCPLDLVNP